MPTAQELREERPSEALGPLTRYETPSAFFPIRDVPSFPYLVENIACAASSVFASTAGLLALLPLLPLSILRSLIPRKKPVGKQVVVITGSTGQIGGAFLEQYDLANHHLVLLIREGSKFKEPETATFETRTYDQAETTGKELKAVFKEIAREYGGIDLLVAVTGIAGHMEETYQRAGTHSWGLDIVKYTCDVNVTGTVNVVMACWEAMLPFKKGSIAIIASSAALFAPASFAAYASSKAFVYHFGQYLRILSVPHNIKVSIICPGFIDSPMTRNMRSYGSIMPDAAFANASGLAGRTARALRNNEGTVLWPRNQVIPLYAAPAVGPINEEIGRWIGASMFAAGQIIA